MSMAWRIRLPVQVCTTVQACTTVQVCTIVLVTIAVVAVALPAHACNANGEQAIFACEAAHGRKFIELCAPAPLSARDGYLRYRFGAQDKDGNETRVELAYPDE